MTSLSRTLLRKKLTITSVANAANSATSSHWPAARSRNDGAASSTSSKFQPGPPAAPSSAGCAPDTVATRIDSAIARNSAPPMLEIRAASVIATAATQESGTPSRSAETRCVSLGSSS